MIGLAEAMVDRGHRVSFTVTNPAGKLRRSSIGWPQLTESRCTLRNIPTYSAAEDLARSFGPDAVHIFQGLRGRPIIERALTTVCANGAHPWCAMERVDERRIHWPAKRLWYRFLMRRIARFAPRYLAIGKDTREWLIARGASPGSVFPFAYFLTPQHNALRSNVNPRVKVGYVGQLIRRKRVDLLMKAVSTLNRDDYDLTIIGHGPEDRACRTIVREALPPEQQHWLGVQPMDKVRKLMGKLDLVVLPSDHDGWGAVISEALIAGTPVICSDRCGAAAAIYQPDMGSVFRHGDQHDLCSKLSRAIDAGPVTPALRVRVQRMAQVLTTISGAAYLESLLDAAEKGIKPPSAPWMVA
jgi:glycosyltransferase involved in cell wall biosynthesis